MKKTATQLIEARVNEMPAVGAESYRYVDMSTGMYFSTEEPATYSPYSGGMNIESADDVDQGLDMDAATSHSYEQQQQQMTSIPGNQKDPKKQNPLLANPTPPPGPTVQMTQAAPNPALPDVGPGQTQADASGKVGMTPTPVPTTGQRRPGERLG